MNVVSAPRGFPPGVQDIKALTEMARKIRSAFRSRLIAADFAKEENGEWLFIEAGPGNCAGTGHEGVFKAVASRLRGEEFVCAADTWAGLLAK